MGDHYLQRLTGVIHLVHSFHEQSAGVKRLAGGAVLVQQQVLEHALGKGVWGRGARGQGGKGARGQGGKGARGRKKRENTQWYRRFKGVG